jgi:hypothetical protein
MLMLVSRRTKLFPSQLGDEENLQAICRFESLSLPRPCISRSTLARSLIQHPASFLPQIVTRSATTGFPPWPPPTSLILTSSTFSILLHADMERVLLSQGSRMLSDADLGIVVAHTAIATPRYCCCILAHSFHGGLLWRWQLAGVSPPSMDGGRAERGRLLQGR